MLRPWILLSAITVMGCADERAPADFHRASRGVLDGYERGRVWGWAQIVGDDAPVNVRIEVDGRPITTVVADQVRQDLVDKGLHGTGAAGFSTVIEELQPGAEVEAFIDETEAALTNGPCVVQGDLGVSSCTEGMPRGVIGGYENGRVWGWAQIVGQRDPIQVRIEVDGQVVATVMADRPRADLVEKRLHPTGAAGFETDISEIRDGAEIVALVDERHHALINSPIVFRRPSDP